MKRLVIDLDDTICRNPHNDYSKAEPIYKVIEKLKDYKRLGFQIIINTSRNIRTYEGNVGKITAFTLPIIIDWLNLHEVPYDEIYLAKPWCGSEGFYVEDKAIRPSEFLALDYQSIMKLLDAEK
jgi:capsule biosynthesis phosphatase